MDASRTALCVDVFKCISMLAKGLGEHLGDLLDQIIQVRCGLPPVRTHVPVEQFGCG